MIRYGCVSMRYLFIANRLPFRLEPEGDSFRFHHSPGGLISSLSAYIATLRQEASEIECAYIGWPGTAVAKEKQPEIERLAAEQYASFPVFLSHEAIEKYYYGFCNKVIWPLFHYFPSLTHYDPSYWEAYGAVNKQFAERILRILQPGDIVCIQDYQLMLLPSLLREANPGLTISFFLHTPFPTYEVYRLLPKAWRHRILEGILGADQVGFHTQDYTQYFLTSVQRMLGYQHAMGILALEERRVKVDTFPLGIDYQKYHRAVALPQVATAQKQLEQTLGGRKLIFSVDRLDYTKGITNRLLGYELFLNEHPEWHDRVVLLLNAEPSRTQIEHYRSMKDEIEKLVGRINGAFGTLAWTPVLYQYTSLSFEEMVTRYSMSDVALITPLRDGMNLVAKEFIAASGRKNGVLVLSEMAGSVKELSEALLINPTHKEEIAQAITTALTMSEEEKALRLRRMQERVRKYDVYAWAQAFNTSLVSFKKKQRRQTVRLTKTQRQKLRETYQVSGRRLIFLDYDGTLVPFAPTPEQAAPSAAVVGLLRSLASQPNNEVVLISGRDKETMQTWFPIRQLALVAEHGIWVRDRGEYYWRLRKRIPSVWKDELRPLLARYTERVPGTFLEEKEYSLAWHYRLADSDLAEDIARELVADIVQFSANTDIGVLRGSKVIEVKNSNVNKGIAAQAWLEKKRYDMILAIGDDATDEDLFKGLPAEAVTVKVGASSPHARFTIASPGEVIALLEELLELDYARTGLRPERGSEIATL